MTRHKFINTSHLVLLAILFAQSALAATACLKLGVGPRSVFAAAHAADCETGSASHNLCLLNFVDQSDQASGQVALPGTVNIPVFVVDVQPARARAVRPARVPTQPKSCDPPIRIRYCSLLI